MTGRKTAAKAWLFILLEARDRWTQIKCSRATVTPGGRSTDRSAATGIYEAAHRLQSRLRWPHSKNASGPAWECVREYRRPATTGDSVRPLHARIAHRPGILAANRRYQP